MELEFSTPCVGKGKSVCCPFCQPNPASIERKSKRIVKFPDGFHTVYDIQCTNCGANIGQCTSSAEQFEIEAVYTEIDPSIADLVAQCGGYCPCAIEQNEDTLCPCKEFRESETGTVCRCGRYKK